MTIFFDRNVGRRLPEALRLLGLDVAWHDERGFGPKTPDEEWLLQAGANQWTVVTHDARFIHNESEKRALVEARVRCFVLSGGSADRWSKVRALAYSWDRIQEIQATQAPPFIWRRSPNGRWSRVYP